jgi:hypothetical protein
MALFSWVVYTYQHGRRLHEPQKMTQTTQRRHCLLSYLGKDYEIRLHVVKNLENNNMMTPDKSSLFLTRIC